MSGKRSMRWLAIVACLPGVATAQMAHKHGQMHGMHGENASETAEATGRSPDYSDGIGYAHMPGMDMRDDAALSKVMVDRLEAFHGRDGNGQQWEMQAWYGNDIDKLWLRSEGERSAGALEEADIEVLWSHAVAAFWDTQLGVRQDFGEGPSRTWAAFGIQGLAPYWFEVEATAYVGSSGRTAARLGVSYELLFTQRLILEPELEANLYGKGDPARDIGSGLSDMRLGLRLRYEIRRRFAPYVGIAWTHRFGASADYARADGEPVTDRQWVAGVRWWF